MKLRWNNAVMAAAVLVPVIGSASIAVHLLAQAERNAALGGLHKTAAATILAIDRDILEADAALRTLVSTPAAFTGDAQSLHAAATAVNGADERTWTVIVDETGRQLINTRAQPGSTLPRFVHRPGTAAAAAAMDAPVVTNLVNDPSTGGPATLIERTVLLQDGRCLLVAKVFPAAYFNRAFQKDGRAADWVTAIFDRDYITIARTHKPDQFVGKPAKPDTAAALANPTMNILRHEIRGGIEVYDVFARSSVSGWSVALGAPVDIVESAVRKAVTISVLGFLLSALLGGAAAILYGRRLVRAMTELGEAARRLGQGKPLMPLERCGINEVDEVHAALFEAAALLDQEREQKSRVEEQREHLVLAADEARRHAETQNRAKDEFIALLGHELRNPLSAISGAVTVMEVMEPTGDRAVRARQIIKRQSEHLARMITDLLDLSRVMAGKVYLEKQPLDLGKAVLQCIDTLRASRKELPSIHSSCESGIEIFADPTRLDQMLVNLLGNAAKFTPPSGSIYVTVSASAQAATVEITDTGMGIPADILPRIFDAFVQGEQTLERAQGGLGIGLSLVRRLAEMHGGTVTAHSEGKDRGASFTLRLPLSTAHAGEGTPLTARAPSRRLTVLLVDDHDDSREMNAVMLRSEGHAVLECANATDVFQCAQLAEVDVALIDIGLPGMDGYEIARRLRKQIHARSLRLIALTGYGSPADQKRALEAGFDLHLIKPVSQQVLLQALESE